MPQRLPELPSQPGAARSLKGGLIWLRDQDKHYQVVAGAVLERFIEENRK